MASSNDTQQQITDADPEAPRRLPPVELAVFREYAAAQEAVDHLSDAGFPVSEVSIVWSGLRRVEYVTGRRTIARAALQGALSGAWFGAAIGLLIGAFATLEPGQSALEVVIAYTLLGALTVAIFQAVVHWSSRGTRDFDSMSKLDAERYEVWVEAPHAVQARSLLGLDRI